MRVVSLLASGTEIVCALGQGKSLVGRSHECDNPPWVQTLPCCSEPAFDVTVSSREIDAEVNRRIRDGEPLYRLNTDLISALVPDLLITQEHCSVCAVTPGDVERSGSEPRAAHVVALNAGSLDAVFEGMVTVARALGMERKGDELVSRERLRLAGVSEKTAGRRKPSVVMLEWMSPLFAMGNWGPELCEIANGELLIGEKGKYSGAIGWEQVAAADPEVLIVAPCGFSLERTLSERAVLEQLPGWNSLRAVESGKAAFADGNLFFNRSGTTVTRTAEIIAEILHGVRFAESAEGVHWCWA